MKTIGLLGGMSWESSALYYRIINEVTRKRLGGHHSASSLMYSVDFAEVEALQHQGRWEESARLMVEGARRLERGGADFLVLCTNTMHKLAREIESGVGIPLLHIADATAEPILAAGLRRVGLLGTRFTMEEQFYRGRLTDRYGLEVIVPEVEGREAVHQVIYDELCRGIIRPESKRRYLTIIDDLTRAGAQGIILGCTEIELLVQDGDAGLPLFPSSRIHAIAAVERALT